MKRVRSGRKSLSHLIQITSEERGFLCSLVWREFILPFVQHTARFFTFVWLLFAGLSYYSHSIWRREQCTFGISELTLNVWHSWTSCSLSGTLICYFDPLVNLLFHSRWRSSILFHACDEHHFIKIKCLPFVNYSFFFHFPLRTCWKCSSRMAFLFHINQKVLTSYRGEFHTEEVHYKKERKKRQL